jgi:dipeptide transport system substrate-binding protein
MKRYLWQALAVAGLTLSAIAPVQAQNKTLVYCSEGSPETFNPQLATSGTTFDASSIAIYNRLVEVRGSKTEAEPGLAQSWTVSDDGLSYTFYLRRGVQWHTTRNFTPTRPFNADDVLFSFKRMMDEKHPYHKVSGGNYIYFNEVDGPNLIKSVEKVDDYTVKITLTKPDATFISILTLHSFSILSAEYADKLLKAGTPERLDTDPVGTGPFVLVNYQKDSAIRYTKNDKYWRGAAKIDTLVFAITKDASIRYQKMRAGECHVMAYPNPAEIESMKADKNLRVLQQEGFNIGYLAFNTEKKPFNDKRVRQAINMALNKANIVKAVYLGSGTPATNPIPPTLWSYNKSVKDYQYNVNKAKELLAAAGYPNGFEATLWWMPVQRPYNPNAKAMAELMQADLAKVGIKVRLVSYEWGEYLDRLRKGEHDMGLLGWTGDYGDPDNFFGNLLSCAAAGSSTARWCHKPFDDLIVKARQVSNQAERTKLYEQAQVIFKEEAPWFTIAHSIATEITRSNVTGYQVSPFGSHDFYGVELK